MSLLLSDDELHDITHLRQPAAQARFLERMRVPYRRRADGTLLVGRAAMERAMLASTKMQTRREVKGLTDKMWIEATAVGSFAVCYDSEPSCGTGVWEVTEHSHPIACPYGQPGDRLWVRENGWQRPADRAERGWPYAYDADAPFGVGAANEAYREEGWKRRPSIHMPRWASRILLEITDVRVERLQAISRGDAMAEGCPFPNMAQGDDPRKWYAGIWDELNGPGSWAANPWVWAVSFRRVPPTSGISDSPPGGSTA